MHRMHCDAVTASHRMIGIAIRQTTCLKHGRYQSGTGILLGTGRSWYGTGRKRVSVSETLTERLSERERGRDCWAQSMEAQMQAYIEGLQLSGHPEGGFFKETFRSKGEIPQHALENYGFGGARNFSTSIYFLLPGSTFSALHRILSDETWYYHAGAPLEVYMLFDDGTLKVEKIGPSFTDGSLHTYNTHLFALTHFLAYL